MLQGPFLKKILKKTAIGGIKVSEEIVYLIEAHEPNTKIISPDAIIVEKKGTGLNSALAD